MRTCQLKKKTITEEHRSFRIAGGWRRVDNPTKKNDLSGNPKKKAKSHTGVSSQLGGGGGGRRRRRRR
jgi:hypothetical protein